MVNGDCCERVAVWLVLGTKPTWFLPLEEHAPTSTGQTPSKKSKIHYTFCICHKNPFPTCCVLTEIDGCLVNNGGCHSAADCIRTGANTVRQYCTRAHNVRPDPTLGNHCTWDTLQVSEATSDCQSFSGVRFQWPIFIFWILSDDVTITK